MGLRRLAAAGCAAIAMGAFPAWAGGTADTRASGMLDDTIPTDGPHHVQFTCTGSGTCTGVAIFTVKPNACSNSQTYNQDLTLTGFDLTHPGTLSGNYSVSVREGHVVNPDGTCTFVTSSGATWPYTGSWDGTSGTLNVAAKHGDGRPMPLVGPFSASLAAAPSPVFPMAVTASITTTTANASADIQPKPADVGTQQSVFVFAHAPTTALKDAPAKDAPVICVLAQVNGQGQLIAVSAATMQAYLSGVLGSQAQAVTILSNVSTPNVAGATFFVGYGPSASGMLTSGNYQNAITIPGTTQCSASLANAPAPTTPGALTGLWWNAAESGWGIHFTQRGSNVFAAWYTYDAAGNPKWYVSTCSGFTGSSGTCNGDLLQVVGPSFFGASFNPALVNSSSVGSLQVTFTNGSAASMTYTVSGQTRTVSLTRQPLATGTTPPAVDYTDIWYDGPAESGWGMAMAQQFGVNFLAWYVYDASGRPTWLVATCIMSGSSCAGTLFRTVGPPLGPTFNTNLVQATPAGTVLVIFTDANNAILSYTVDGVSATKPIKRQLF